MYRLKLELDGYHVAVVADDDRVLEEAARTRPDMIYIDLRVGDERRFKTLHQLRTTTVTRESAGDHPLEPRSERADRPGLQSGPAGLRRQGGAGSQRFELESGAVGSRRFRLERNPRQATR